MNDEEVEALIRVLNEALTQSGFGWGIYEISENKEDRPDRRELALAMVDGVAAVTYQVAELELQVRSRLQLESVSYKADDGDGDGDGVERTFARDGLIDSGEEARSSRLRELGGLKDTLEALKERLRMEAK